MDKAQQEAQMSEKLNDEALARIKKETEQEIQRRSAAVWFEDDEEFMLRDGSIRKVPPLLFGDARIFMEKLKTVNPDVIMLNFSPGANNAEGDLYDILAMAFRNYPDIVTEESGKLIPNRAYIDRNVDIRLTRKIIDTMLDVNALKK